MGYSDHEGIILHRRNLFETDQEITILTSCGGLQVRVPNARVSQKTYCGRLQPPNRILARLYRARENSRWTLSHVELDVVYSELLQRDDLRYHIWPLLSLYRDLFPEGESPGRALTWLTRAFDYLLKDYFPPELVVDRLLVNTARETGVGHSLQICSACGCEQADCWYLYPELGVRCGKCRETKNREEYPLAPEILELYRALFKLNWSEIVSCEFDVKTLAELEALMYRFFHYHFDISLKALKVRNQL